MQVSIRAMLDPAIASCLLPPPYPRGRNVEGQTGVESAIVVTRPTAILELHGQPLASLHAGKLTSAAVTEAGEAMTWGCGAAGKLGHGSPDNMHAPTRVRGMSVRHARVGLLVVLVRPRTVSAPHNYMLPLVKQHTAAGPLAPAPC